MDTPLLNNIAFDLVKDKVIADQMKEYEMTEQQQENVKTNEVKKSNKGKDDDEEEDLEDELDEVDSEEDNIIKNQIKQRLEQQQKKLESEKAKLARKYGDVRDIVETEFLDTMIKNDKVVCHFYHDQFERCKIMDKHFRQMANLHPETLFVKINAEKTPFFTNKLNVKVNILYFSLNFFLFLQVLPTVISFIDGKQVAKYVGFEDLGMKDDFPTINLLRKLVKDKMITPLNKSEKGIMAMNIKGKSKKADESDDSDYQKIL